MSSRNRRLLLFKLWLGKNRLDNNNNYSTSSTMLT